MPKSLSCGVTPPQPVDNPDTRWACWRSWCASGCSGRDKLHPEWLQPLQQTIGMHHCINSFCAGELPACAAKNLNGNLPLGNCITRFLPILGNLRQICSLSEEANCRKDK